MKTGFIAVCALFLGIILFPEISHARETTRNYTCEGVKDLVKRSGAIVLNTKNNHVYRRFVRNRSFCTSDEVTRSFTVPTKTGNCRLKICRMRERRLGFKFD